MHDLSWLARIPSRAVSVQIPQLYYYSFLQENYICRKYGIGGTCDYIRLYTNVPHIKETVAVLKAYNYGASLEFSGNEDTSPVES